MACFFSILDNRADISSLFFRYLHVADILEFSKASKKCLDYAKMCPMHVAIRNYCEKKKKNLIEHNLFVLDKLGKELENKLKEQLFVVGGECLIKDGDRYCKAEIIKINNGCFTLKKKQFRIANDKHNKPETKSNVKELRPIVLTAKIFKMTKQDKTIFIESEAKCDETKIDDCIQARRCTLTFLYYHYCSSKDWFKSLVLDLHINFSFEKFIRLINKHLCHDYIHFSIYHTQDPMITDSSSKKKLQASFILRFAERNRLYRQNKSMEKILNGYRDRQVANDKIMKEQRDKITQLKQELAEAKAKKINYACAANIGCYNAKWSHILNDEQRHSYCKMSSGLFSNEELYHYFQKIQNEMNIEWCTRKYGNEWIAKQMKWYVNCEYGCNCVYNFVSNNVQIYCQPIDFPSWLLELTYEICRRAEEPFYCQNLTNVSCLVRKYENGYYGVGYHSDNEELFKNSKKLKNQNDDIKIISLSLGETRKFQIKLINNDEKKQDIEPTEIALRNGDVLIMDGLMQKYYKHKVPKEKHIVNTRYNLTWRLIKTHNCNKKKKKKKIK
eukprot:257943_1